MRANQLTIHIDNKKSVNNTHSDLHDHSSYRNHWLKTSSYVLQHQYEYFHVGTGMHA